MKEIMPFILIGSLVLVYVLSYALNKKTPVPEECKDIFNDTACKSCNNFTCGHHGGE